MPGRAQWPPLSRACPLARWNQLDLAIVLLSIMGITLEEIEMNAALPINPTIIRIMRVLRIARGRWPRPPRSGAVGRVQGRGSGVRPAPQGLCCRWGLGALGPGGLGLASLGSVRPAPAPR